MELDLPRCAGLAAIHASLLWKWRYRSSLDESVVSGTEKHNQSRVMKGNKKNQRGVVGIRKTGVLSGYAEGGQEKDGNGLVERGKGGIHLLQDGIVELRNKSFNIRRRRRKL